MAAASSLDLKQIDLRVIGSFRKPTGALRIWHANEGFDEIRIHVAEGRAEGDVPEFRRMF